MPKVCELDILLTACVVSQNLRLRCSCGRRWTD